MLREGFQRVAGRGVGIQLQNEQTSITLIEGVKSRDQYAWKRLVFLYEPLVAGWCQRWNFRPQDREDVVQEVFQAVSQQIDGFRRDRPGDKFRKWLWTLTRNKASDWFRKREGASPEGGSAALQMLQQIAEATDDDESESASVMDGLVQRALSAIRPEFSENVWQMFWRAAIEGHAPRDIAGDVGLTPNAVRVAKFRVLKRLRLELSDEFDSGE